jgi:hypothetical protein
MSFNCLSACILCIRTAMSSGVIAAPVCACACPGPAAGAVEWVCARGTSGSTAIATFVSSHTRLIAYVCISAALVWTAAISVLSRLLRSGWFSTPGLYVSAHSAAIKSPISSGACIISRKKNLYHPARFRAGIYVVYMVIGVGTSAMTFASCPCECWLKFQFGVKLGWQGTMTCGIPSRLHSFAKAL